MKAFLKVLITGRPVISEASRPVRPQLCEGLVEPAVWAEYFAASLQSQGFCLDFSLESLALEVDRFLDSKLFLNYNLIVAQANLSPGNKLINSPQHQQAQRLYRMFQEYETGLSAYIGETLRQAYQASWSGSFSAQSPIHNQYLSSLKLEDKIYYPSRYPAMRLTGAHFQSGRLPAHLNKLLGSSGQLAA